MTNLTFREFVVEMNANHGVMLEATKPSKKTETPVLAEIVKSARRKRVTVKA